MHFKNFTLCELCFDTPSLEAGGNTPSQHAILTFQAEEEITLDPLSLAVIHDSVYGWPFQFTLPHWVCLDGAQSRETMPR